MFLTPALPHEFRKILVRRIPLIPKLRQTLTESLVLIVANILTDFLVPIPHGRENESLIRSQMSFFAKDNPTVEVLGITTNRRASTFRTNRHIGNGFHNLMPILFKNGTHFPRWPHSQAPLEHCGQRATTIVENTDFPVFFVHNKNLADSNSNRFSAEWARFFWISFRPNSCFFDAQFTSICTTPISIEECQCPMFDMH